MVALLLSAPPAAAQDAVPASADWARVEAGALALEGPAAYRPTLEEWAARARVFLPDLERQLGVQPAGPILMVLIPPDAPSQGGAWAAVARLDRAAPAWAAGFALSELRVGGVRIAQAERYPFGDPVGVLAHEVAHVLIHDAAGAGADEVPRWFAEGVATRAQRRWGLRDALVYSSGLLAGSLPTLEELDRAFASSETRARLAYAASFDFVDWTAEEYGEDAVRRVLAELRTRPFREAWREATGVPLARSEASWRRTSLALYRWVPALTGAGTLWLAITFLFLLASWRRRARTRKLYERWEEEGEAGFSLIEALVALAILALVLLMGLGLVWQQRRVLVRVEAREAADAALAEALEVLRSGAAPPVSGPVPVLAPPGPAEGLRVTARVTLAEPPPDLYRARLVARYRVAGEEVIRTVETQLWRPDLVRLE